MMLSERAVSAYQDFTRVTGWVGNLAIGIEHEFFGRDGPSPQFRDRYGREGAPVPGLTVEQHLPHLREDLIPLSEHCRRVIRDALAALGTLLAAPRQALHRSRLTR